MQNPTRVSTQVMRRIKNSEQKIKIASSTTNGIQLGEWTLNRFTLKDQHMYHEYIKRSEVPTNLFLSSFDYLWAISQLQSYTTFYKIVDGMIAIFFYTASTKKLDLHCLPYGAGSVEHVLLVLTKCLQYCQRYNGKKKQAVVREINQHQFNFLRQSNTFDLHFRTHTLIGVERHVGIQQLVALEGKSFRNVRHCINQFHHLFPAAKVRKAEPSDFDKLAQLKKHWNQTAGKKYNGVHDDYTYRLITKHYEALHHIVLVVEEQDQIIGMVSGGVLPTGEAWACFSKRMSHAKGLSDVLLVELAREIHRLSPNTKVLNLGRDAGPKGGLRRFKDKFRPLFDLPRYQLLIKA